MDSDYRLTNQMQYLYAAELKKARFKSKPQWDHEHCAFCWYKFLDTAEGYSTIDEKHWICEKCYNDFKIMFDWKI